MAYTQDDIDTLKAALATGARIVEFGSGADRRKVEYFSRADMLAQLDDMVKEVSPNSAAPRVSFVRHCRD
ncbi:hypothetical protein [Rhodopseudomonas sp. BR0G17]|uniref:phage head-tail joining protein n=1 Tax=Rhodopseudomonas sp. BR0G17 TaxID=2269368 RepID=UPI0013DFC96E|nr:hypothetical protein [Rhodopseudomonas sp. BR0G17]NEW96635.1 hypothetical protein [Rhodopseudomonas sp. BR0G17]